EEGQEKDEARTTAKPESLAEHNNNLAEEIVSTDYVLQGAVRKQITVKIPQEQQSESKRKDDTEKNK
ncbi:MAG: hypothetical protein ACQERJ_04835, partial [Bacillota bacterium]